MATTVARLEAILSANTRDFDRAMSSSEGKMHRVGKVAGAMGLAIAGGLAFGLEKSVQAAMDAQKSQTRLEQSFTNAGLKAALYAKGVEAAEKAGRKLGFTNTETKQSLGSLITSTGSYVKAVQQLRVAQDLARFSGKGLEAATKALTMAHAGSLRPIKQLGIDVPKVTLAVDALKRSTKDHSSEAYKNALAIAKAQDKQATFKNVLEATNKAVHGQADEFSKTAAGGMQVFHANMENLQEEAGKKLLPALTKVLEKVTAFIDYLDKHPKVAKAMAAALGVLAAAFIALSVAESVAAVGATAFWTAATAGLILIIPALIALVIVLEKKFGIFSTALQFVKQHWEAFVAAIPVFGPLALALIKNFDHIHDIAFKVADAFHTVANWIGKCVQYVKDLISWLGKIHVPKFKLPDVNPFKGDAANPQFVPPGVKGPNDLHGASEVMRPFANQAARYGLHITSGRTDHSKYTSHGTISDHWYGKALDEADGPRNMAAFFRSLIGNPRVKQAFYDPLGSIFGGAWNAYREGGHSDHVHVATYDQGGWLRPGWNLAYNGLGRPEPVGDLGPINLYVDGQKLFSWFRGAERKHQRRNGG